MITHDLGVMAEMADHVAVMYAGHVVEYGPVGEIFNRPSTRIPCPAVRRSRAGGLPDRLTTIEARRRGLPRRPAIGCPF